MQRIKTSNRWVQRLWMAQNTAKVLMNNGLQCPAIPVQDSRNLLCCDLNFNVEIHQRIYVEPTGYIARFNDVLYYFASTMAEEEYNFRASGERIIITAEQPQIATYAVPEEQVILRLEQNHPVYFHDRLHPGQASSLDLGYSAVSPEGAYALWATEFPTEFDGEPAAYEVLIHQDDARAISAMLAGIFEDIRPVKLLDGYMLSCSCPFRGLTMTQAVHGVARPLLNLYIS